MLTLVNRRFSSLVVTLFTSLPDLSVVFSLFCLFVFVVCLVLFSLVAAAFLANKDIYNRKAYLLHASFALKDSHCQ